MTTVNAPIPPLVVDITARPRDLNASPWVIIGGEEQSLQSHVSSADLPRSRDPDDFCSLSAH